MAGKIKGHISGDVNEGNNETTAEEFQTAVESNRGISDVKVFLCENSDKFGNPKPIKGITQFTNFAHEQDGFLYACKAIIGSRWRIQKLFRYQHFTSKYIFISSTWMNTTCPN